jgi:hypothetical protein
MPYQYTFPTLYDDMRSFSFSIIRKLNLFNPEQFKSGELIWSINGQKIASIYLSTNPEQKVMRLWYLANGEQVDYQIKLEAIPSNLGSGYVWYFLCPVTGKRCLKLYGGKYFLHREAYPEALYKSQTYSRYGRYLDKFCRISFKQEILYSEINGKYFKTHYAGKPTKRYHRMISTLEQAESMEYQYLINLNRAE